MEKEQKFKFYFKKSENRKKNTSISKEKIEKKNYFIKYLKNI